MFQPYLSKEEVNYRLSKLQPLNYNRFRWWRMYDSINTPLYHRKPLKDRILNGDFDYSHYEYQVMWCEYQLNGLWEECKPDISMYSEKSSVLRARRKRLMEDFIKDEEQRFQYLIKSFLEYFNCDKETLLNEMLNSSEDLIGFYYIMDEKYKHKFTPYPKRGRGRPKKI